MLSFDQFKKRPKISNLPASQQRARYANYKKSVGGRRRVERPKQKLPIPDRSCVVHYAQALRNPFGTDEAVCLPTDLAIPSQKMKLVLQGTMEVGTQIGFVNFNPYNAFNSAATNTIHAIVASTSAYTLGTITNDSSATGVTANDFTQSPYTPADSSSSTGVNVRVVAAGLRVWYAGPELSRAGTYFALRDPNNTSLFGLSVDAMGAFQNIMVERVTNEPIEIVHRPSRVQDFAFNFHGSADSNSICVAVRAAPNDKFAYKAVVHVEFVGGTARRIQGLTKSHSDVVGLSQVINALPNTDKGGPQEASALFKRLAWQGATHLIGRVAKQYL